MRKYRRTIIFTKTPLEGFYRYKDMFQVFPAHLENMPYSKLQEHFPVILEYWVEEEDKVVVEKDWGDFVYSYTKTATLLTKEDRILSLLTAFTNHRFFHYTDLTGSWGMPILKDDPGEEANSWSSKWCWPEFMFPGMPDQLRIQSFTECDYLPVPRTYNKLYYVDDPNIDFDKYRNITFPELLDETLDAYFIAQPATRELLDVAISYVASAAELRTQKKTLSLLAAFTSMETMINLEYKDSPVEKCLTCSQPRYSISKKFREFLLTYVATADSNKKKFNDYYTLRSKLVHAGRQVRNEKLFSGLSDDEQHQEFITQIEIIQIGKLSIVNWLLMHYRNGTLQNK